MNPDSGPGVEPLPGHDYVREVPRLNGFHNVRTVGYVAIDYCRKPLHKVCEEVSVYAGWNRDYKGQINGLYVEGIFVDETHNHPDAVRSEYMDSLGRYIREEVEGLKGDILVSLI